MWYEIDGERDRMNLERVRQAAATGIDLFRVFDSLNWVENMRVAMDAVIKANKVCEGTICYTGDLMDPNRSKYDLKYYVGMAKELEAAGAHVLGLKDMRLLSPPPMKFVRAASFGLFRSVSLNCDQRQPPLRYGKRW